MSIFVQNLKIYIYKSSLSGGLTVRPFLVTRKLLPGDKEGKKALRLQQAAVGHKEVSPLCVQNLLSLMAYILLHSPMMS